MILKNQMWKEGKCLIMRWNQDLLIDWEKVEKFKKVQQTKLTNLNKHVEKK